MPDTVLFLTWFLGVPILLMIGTLLVFGVEWATWTIGNAAAHCQNWLTGWRIDADARSETQQNHAEFLRWLGTRAGIDRSGSVDEDLVRAQQQTELIQVLVSEEVPKAVMRCLETHRTMAEVAGVYHLAEIAYEPECYQSRVQIVWLLAHTVEFLQAYPLRTEDERLLYNSIVLRKRALPICRRCPYVHLAADRLPRLCPTAELIQVRTTGVRND
ncbi:MAG TPA: hypothetical protein VFB00_08180 [Terriglobales bacterium]|nr:hypothetical protein [Terriglobales bacterium]